MVRKIRLYSGLVLFTYLLTHLLNHALGLHSLDLMNAGREPFLALWRSWPGTVALYGAILLHAGLALWGVYLRQHFRLRPWEAAQLALGLLIPPLLFLHVLGTRLAHSLYGMVDDYYYLEFMLNIALPERGVSQVLVLVIAWLHGCMGLHYWLRYRRGYDAWKPYALSFALLLPVLALAGHYVAGREITRLVADAQWFERFMADYVFPSEEQAAWLLTLERCLTAAFFVLICGVFAARWGRHFWQRWRGSFRVTYPDGRTVRAMKGISLLDVSNLHDIPHASVCGGRGRCSTCRVRVGAGLSRLPDPEPEETKVLARIGAAESTRLACQTYPIDDVEVAPLLPGGSTLGEAKKRHSSIAQGQEREIAVLFADIRGFTTLSEKKLPYDVVFILNRYFEAMGTAVGEAGGRVDKFIGDGVMALFGLERGVELGCRNALRAAHRMAERLDELNAQLAHELPQPLRIGIGIHTGPAIVGELGWGPATSLTAIGDAVNTASRLESLTKELGVQLVVSRPVAEIAGVDLSAFEKQSVQVRGRRSELEVWAIKRALDLPSP